MRLTVLPTLAAFSLAATGCAIHKPMPRPLTPEAVEQVQEALESRGAWLEYGYPGQPSLVAAVQKGSFQRFDQGRPSLLLYTDEPAHAVPLEHARELRVNNHWLGTLEGLGIGLLSGVILGVWIAPAGKPRCDPGSDGCLGMDFSGTFMMMGIITGTTIGTIVGAAVGQRYVYTF
jgi:hypothetical protein